MALIHETLSDQFYEWENRGRGWRVWPKPVSPEPPFQPFFGHSLPEPSGVDDGRRPTFLSSLVASLTGNTPAPSTPQDVEEGPEPDELHRGPLVELQTSLPTKLDISTETFSQLLRNLSRTREPMTFELVGVPGRVNAQFAVAEDDASVVRRQLQAHFPDAHFRPTERALENAWESSDCDEVLIVEFGLDREFMFPLLTGKLDPFVGIVGALSELGQGEVGVFQVIFEPVRNDWAESIVRSVTDSKGKPFFVNMPELASAAENKMEHPLYAAVVRIAAKCASYDRVVSLSRELAASLAVFSHPRGNRLIPLSNEEYPFDDHVEDLLSRQSRRSGMLLSAHELMGFVHLPGSTVRSPAFARDTGKSKPVPTNREHRTGLFLGTNEHGGESTKVCLTDEERTRHVHIIGSSGTGKSTLLLNLIRQGIENYEGLAVLDPHGDLVDEILAMVPPERTGNVVLIDPSDEEYSVGFNILSAHSDLEKNLLASDLVSVFERLSTSWGDQMGIVLQNAILAFLESDRGGTLADMRRFLVEPAFREQFLATVRDPDIAYYWRHAFKELSGNRSIGPVITRLETFLTPKPIRYMVAQSENRIDFADIMDTGKIFLAKLPQGQIGKENSFLLGSLLVSKFQQLAMSRQAQRIASRRLFTLFIDEFHNFITPSMAEILSGARKYKLSLVLAHQELRQLEKDREVASAVLSNPYTRIVFRVGDHDSRTLENGFSAFEARDLQNLETGQAICRIEKADGDFNLSIPLPVPIDPSEAEARRASVIAGSRARYGTPRSEVEATLRAKLEQTPPKEKTPTRSREKPTIKEPEPQPEPTDSKEKNVPRAPITPPPAPAVELVPPPQVESSPPPDKGIGGNQHNLIREHIEVVARSLGYTASRETKTGDGGKIDVVLEKSDGGIACEIAITTTIDHEVGNVAKCLKAGFKHVAVISPSADRLKKIKHAVSACIPSDEATRVRYFEPESFIKFLRERSTSEAASAPPGPSERKVGKYTVKRMAVTLTAEELKAREAAALSLLAEAMRKKKP